MARNQRVFLLLLAAGSAGMVLAGVPEALANAELFRLDRIEVEGTRYLAADEVLRVAALPPAATVWGATGPVEERVASHPLVRKVRVRRRIPSTLRIEIHEREPVALVAAPVLTPVDDEGRLLPLDPAALRLDLPILTDGAGGGGERPADGVPSSRIRILVSELARIGELDPDLATRLSELRRDGDGSVVVRLSDPRVDLAYRPPLRPGRLREALLVLSDALERQEERAPAEVDLRFADQVVVRFTQGTGR